MLAEHARTQEQQHEQAGGQCRLDHDERGQQQRADLKRPADDSEAGAGEPTAAHDQLTHQRQAQAVALRDLARIEGLEGDP